MRMRMRGICGEGRILQQAHEEVVAGGALHGPAEPIVVVVGAERGELDGRHHVREVLDGAVLPQERARLAREAHLRPPQPTHQCNDNRVIGHL
eukprot:6738198-Pyramimonas_sp.AAC.1